MKSSESTVITVSDKQLTKVNKLLNAFIYSSYDGGSFQFEYDQPFENLGNELLKIEEIKEFYDDDLMNWALGNEIKRRMIKPRNLSLSETGEVINALRSNLLLNIADHVIIVPIPKAYFKDLISFGSYTFIPHDFTREQKINVISKITKKKPLETEEMLDHTEKSRSPDFLKYPLLCIKEKHQSASIHYKALNTARVTIYALTCFYYAVIKPVGQNIRLQPASLVKYKSPSHIAILAKENWRQRHNPLNFDPTVPFDITWLSDKKNQRKFLAFFNSLVKADNVDPLRILFLNSLILFNEALAYNTSISTLLLMTAAESVLTQNRNEKRLRLAALLPRLVKIKNMEKSELSEIISDLYIKRNNFVHAGKTIAIMYTDKKEKDALEVGKKAIALFLYQFTLYHKSVKNQNHVSGKDGNESTLIGWQFLLDGLFEKVIQGRR